MSITLDKGLLNRENFQFGSDLMLQHLNLILYGIQFAQPQDNLHNIIPHQIKMLKRNSFIMRHKDAILETLLKVLENNDFDFRQVPVLENSRVTNSQIRQFVEIVSQELKQ